MAGRLPPVPEFGFTGEDFFESWLTGLATDRIKPVAQALSCRAALRVLPDIHTVFSGDLAGSEAAQRMTLAALRTSSTARVALKYPSDEIRAAAEFAAGHSASITYPVLSSPGMSARSAAAYAALCVTRASAHSAADYTIRAVRSAAGSSNSKRNASSASHLDIWKSVTHDSRALVSGTTPLTLLATPLWPQNDVPAWWEESRKRFQARLDLLDRESKRNTGESGNWSQWSQWYNAVAQGRTLWGLPSETAWELEKRIVLGDDQGEEFWTRKPEEINREILRWIREARLVNEYYEIINETDDSEIDLSSIEPPNQIPVATELTVNNEGKIDLAIPGRENR